MQSDGICLKFGSYPINSVVILKILKILRLCCHFTGGRCLESAQLDVGQGCKRGVIAQQFIHNGLIAVLTVPESIQKRFLEYRAEVCQVCCSVPALPFCRFAKSLHGLIGKEHVSAGESDAVFLV